VQILGYFQKNCQKENSRPIGENSPNLITLDDSDSLYKQRYQQKQSKIAEKNRPKIFRTFSRKTRRKARFHGKNGEKHVFTEKTEKSTARRTWSRVTRLGEFSPIGLLFTLGKFL
jgi:hypothetical protein